MGLRLIFAGTPPFAATVLEALLAHAYHIAAAYTQPDRPAGRGRRPRASAVKTLALAHGIPVEQPANLRGTEAARALAAWNADAMIVAAYGLILPETVLVVPRLGCINVHASLLPRWRGAAPIQHAILAGDRETGVSIMQMDAGLDTGPVLRRVGCPIRDDDTGASLHDRLAALAADILVEALAELERGRLRGEPQDESLATYAPRISKRDALLDWSRPAQALERQVRAYNPWPVAYTFRPAAGDRDGEPGVRLRIWRARVVAGDVDAAPGTVVARDGSGIDVATGRDNLRILSLQPAGKRIMSCGDYLNAHSLAVGTCLHVAGLARS